MTTAVYLDRSLSSVYLLWYILKNTSENIIAYNLHLPRRELNKRFSVSRTMEDKDIIDSIANDLNSVRKFTYQTITLDTYDPKWAGIQSLELINIASSVTGINIISMSDTADMLDKSSVDLRAMNRAVFDKLNTTEITLAYPLMSADKGLIDACIELPSSVITKLDQEVANPISISTRKAALSSGVSRETLFNVEKSIFDGTHARYGVENDGNWFVDGDKYYGVVLGANTSPNVIINHPYFKYLIK
jgi:hypothetical protein